MTREQFNLEWNGKKNDDGSVPGQCVNLVHSYFKEVLGLPVFHGNAIDYWTTPPPGFTKIPVGQPPQIGDLVVWDYKPVGHIGILNWYRDKDFNCMEQNNPVGSVCHFQDHPNYKNVLGYLRPKSSKFTIPYTVFNGDPKTMEQARQLILSYSGGKIDCTFDYKTVPTQPGVFTTEQQIIFLKTRSTNPFVFYFYDSGIFHTQMATAEVPTTGKIMTCATPFEQKVTNIAYEIVNALYDYFHKAGGDVNSDPSEDYIKQKLITILPAILGGV